jgi:hypothetical protein
MSVVNFASWNPNASQAQAQKPKATWWINFDLAEGVPAGLPMDAVNKDGNRIAKGTLCAFYDWVMTQFKDIPLNTMVPVTINGHNYTLWHGNGEPTSKVDFSGWVAQVVTQA